MSIQNNASTSAGPVSWITFDADNIYVDTSSPTTPESASVVVRYFDAIATEFMGYFDTTITIRLSSENPITPSDQTYDSLQKCS